MTYPHRTAPLQASDLSARNTLGFFAREARTLAHVPRWSIIRQLRHQYLPEHHYYVMLYTVEILRQLKWAGDLGLVMLYVMTHDFEEGTSADIPGPAKRSFVDTDRYKQYATANYNKRYGDEVPDPGEFIRKVVKVADYLDAVMYLAGEVQMGNKAVEYVLREQREWLFNKLFEIPDTSKAILGSLSHTINRAIEHELNGNDVLPVEVKP